jgi:hypothetical protein
MTWGNIVSVRAPAPRAFYNFESSEQAGGIASIFLVLAIWAATVGLWFLLDTLGRGWLIAAGAALLAAAFALYRTLLPKSGELFDAMAETMNERMSA